MSVEPAEVKDVACGMMIDPAKAAAKRTWDGREFFFCSQACAATFDSNPEEYGLEEV
jgi:Cu+-exporting ATPase